jgi:hypothetical protein
VLSSREESLTLKRGFIFTSGQLVADRAELYPDWRYRGKSHCISTAYYLLEIISLAFKSNKNKLNIMHLGQDRPSSFV